MGRGYSIVGKKPLAPTAHARGEIAIGVLEETAADLRALAKMSARAGADEGEPLVAEAEAYERALSFARHRMGLEEPAPKPADVPKPADHDCDYPGCRAAGPYGFGMAGEPGLWACGEHQAEIQARYFAERTERERKMAEALAPKPELAGIGGRMI